MGTLLLIYESNFIFQLFLDIGESHIFADIAGASHSPEPLRFTVLWTSFQCFKIWRRTRCICCVGVYEADENDWKSVLPFEIYCPFDRDNKDTGISAVVAAGTQFRKLITTLITSELYKHHIY